MAAQDKEPIFIVGVQRSGTTLLAAMLGAHSRLSCGPETHFFRFLARARADDLVDPSRWPANAVDFLASIGQAGLVAGTRKTLLDKYRLERADVAGFLARETPSIPAVLRSVTEQYMSARAKARWVEKTPDHLMHLELLREHFPDSPIIRIVRDPRDVALSLTRVPWGADSLLQALLYWDRVERKSRGFFGADHHSHTLRFEDLVASPVAELTKICGFIGEEFEEGMLDTSKTGGDVNSQDAPWKQKAKEPVDAARAAVWRSGLTPQENRLAEAVVGEHLEAWGYARTGSFTCPAEVRPALDGTACRFTSSLGSVANAGVRFWCRTPGETPGARIYIGEPDAWLGRGKKTRALNALPVLMDVLRAACSNKRLYWIAEEDQQWRGWLSYLLRKALSRHRVGPVTCAE